MANPVAREIETALLAAVRSDEFLFDASDAMPVEIGSDAFYKGMVRLFQDGTAENVDQLSREIAGDIEAAWVELEKSADQPSTG
jgi:hypothetical protein